MNLEIGMMFPLDFSVSFDVKWPVSIAYDAAESCLLKIPLHSLGFLLLGILRVHEVHEMSRMKYKSSFVMHVIE